MHFLDLSRVSLFVCVCLWLYFIPVLIIVCIIQMPGMTLRVTQGWSIMKINLGLFIFLPVCVYYRALKETLGLLDQLVLLVFL